MTQRTDGKRAESSARPGEAGCGPGGGLVAPAAWWLGVTLVAALAFTLWPAIDIAAARLVFIDGHFPLAGNPILHGFENIVQDVGIALLALLPLLALGWRRERRGLVFLWWVLVLGPVCVANWGLKDHWGRARPEAVTEFGGDRVFSPPLVPTDQCEKNCSFVSGHATVGFFLGAAGVWYWRRRRAFFAAGALAGTLVGVSRIAQGEHFLSDVVFAWVVVQGTALAVAFLWRGIGAPGQ